MSIEQQVVSSAADGAPASQNVRADVQACIDAMGAHVAILDSRGTIIAVNRGWAECAHANFFAYPRQTVGDNYLAGCDAAAATGDAGATEVADGVRTVLRGERASFNCVYTCRDASRRRSFRLTVGRFEQSGDSRIITAHEDITALAEAEEALRHSDARFRGVFESGVVAMNFWTADGRITDANEAYLQLTGYTREELNAGTLRWGELTAPECVHLDHAAVKEVAERGFCTPYEKEYVLRDGRRLPVLLAGALLPGSQPHGIAFIIDLTERRRAQDAMRAALALNLAVLCSLKELISVLDRDGNIIAVNDAWNRFAAETGGAPLGADFRIGANYLISTTDETANNSNRAGSAAAISPERLRAAKGVRAVLDGARNMFELEYSRPARDGARWFVMTVVPLQPRHAGESSSAGVEGVGGGVGGVGGAVIVHTDITERRRAQDLLRALNARLIQAQEEERRHVARELHDDLTQRIAVLAIDLGRLELEVRQTDPDHARQLRSMNAQIAALSDDVHALSHKLHPSVLDDLGLLAAMESECAAFSRRERIQVVYRNNGVPDDRGVIPAETALCIFRVMQEALRNLAKHARAHRADVTLACRDNQLILTVADSGQGFEPDGPRAHGGYRGLGLASMRERAGLVGGELSIDSAPGRGTTVCMRVKLSRSSS